MQRPSLVWMQRVSRATVVALLFACATPVRSQTSTLLESVKNNPKTGQQLCQQLRQYNRQGVSFTSAQVTSAVARAQSLTPAEAEVLLTYVVGLYCPDVT